MGNHLNPGAFKSYELSQLVHSPHLVVRQLPLPSLEVVAEDCVVHLHLFVCNGRGAGEASGGEGRKIKWQGVRSRYCSSYLLWRGSAEKKTRGVLRATRRVACISRTMKKLFRRIYHVAPRGVSSPTEHGRARAFVRAAAAFFNFPKSTSVVDIFWTVG